MKKELHGYKKGSEAEIHLQSFRAILKKIPNWKTPGHYGIPGFWVSINTSLEKYIKKSQKRLITATSNSTDNIKINRRTKTRKHEWKKKTTVWVFLVTNWQNLTLEDLDMATKVKP